MGRSHKDTPGPRPNDVWVPEWAANVVWYQIFPERFRNGNPNNDPTLADLKGAYPHDDSSTWQIHPWTSDWYKLQPYERINGRSIWFNILRRRYGGDLEGILQKLDYLQELGIRAVYLNPVFDAPSHHKYDGASYHHIDPNFGPDPRGDRRLMAQETPDDPTTWVWTAADRMMLQLIRELHRRKMRVIFDGVFNHMGINSWAFQDVLARQRESPFKDWFKIRSWDDDRKKTRFTYKGWCGVRELPEFRQDARGIVDGPKQYIFAATKRWMAPQGDGNPEDGIDGWRLDVAFCIAHPFWQEWREFVKSINPDAYLTAEVIDPPEALQPYLRGDEFDAVMNYNFAFSCSEYFVRRQVTTTEFDRCLRDLRQAFPPCVAYVMQNLLDSHDSDRIASHIVNRDRVDYRNWLLHIKKSKAKNPEYDTRKPTPQERKIQKLLAIFQMTYVGAPMIYYGDEAGMWGANDPDCRKPMLWPDLEYAAEAFLPDGRERQNPDEVAFDRELFRHYRKLIRIRNRYPVFQQGDYQTLLIDDGRKIYAFSRTLVGQRAVVVLNNGDGARRVQVPKTVGRCWRDLLNDARVFQGADGYIEIVVEPRWGVILLAEQGEDT